MRQEATFLSKLSNRYSAAPYLAALIVCAFLVWMGLQLTVFLHRPMTPTLLVMGAMLTLSGMLLALFAALALWVLSFEVIAFEIDANSLVLERHGRSSLKNIKSLDRLLTLGCIFRPGAPNRGCVEYVILRTNEGFVPMPLDLYESLMRAMQSGIYNLAQATESEGSGSNKT